jgi:predicted NBD/HSP70 family sugar kinase
MSDVTLGVDLSDVIARLAVVDGAGKVIERGIVASHRGVAIKDAARKALHGAGTRVGAIGVALPSPTDRVADDMTSALANATAAATPMRAIPAGTAAALAE